MVAALQHDPQALVRAIQRVGQHKDVGHPGLKRGDDHLPRNRGLGGKRHLLGHAGLASLCPIRRSGLRQEQPPVDQRLPAAAGTGQENADLTVLNSSIRTRVLPHHADGVLSFFTKPVASTTSTAWR